jgi:hypothetical protein
MHWATSSPLIAKNQLLFDIKHIDDFVCEMKYKFNDKFVRTFNENLKKFIDSFCEILNRFYIYNETYEVDSYPRTIDYEMYFQIWKKEINLNVRDVTIDMHWQNKLELIVLNPVFLEVMFGDDCMFETKYIFKSKSLPPEESV